MRVRLGDIIPADVKLLTGALNVDQSALTGESKDADKAPGAVLSSRSIVRRGEGNGVVMLTGANSFLLLLYCAVFSVVSARERRAFWATMPSKALMAALVADALTGTILTRMGLPGLLPLPWAQMLAILVYAFVSCLVVNDAVKVVMTRWRIPTAIA